MPYGGPMLEGKLRMTIDGIALPIPNPDTGAIVPSSERMVFSVTERSMLRAFIHMSERSKVRMQLIGELDEVLPLCLHFQISHECGDGCID